MKVNVIPAFEDNYFFMLEDGDFAGVVDPGDAGPVLKYLESNSKVLDFILVTHHHHDHVGGIADLVRLFPRLKVVGPEGDAVRIPALNQLVKDRDRVDFGTMSFEVIATPGHTSMAICYYSKNCDQIFVGDTLFSLGCGRLFEGTAQQMFNSLQKIKSLPDKTTVFCAHEYTQKNAEFLESYSQPSPLQVEYVREIKNQRGRREATVPFNLGIEKGTNPFLLATNVSEFAKVREARNHF